MSANLVLANIVFPEIVLPDNVFNEIVLPNMVNVTDKPRPDNPYIFHPKQNDEQRTLWKLYKDIEHQHWAWETYMSKIDVPALLKTGHRDDIIQSFHVIDMQLSFFSSGLPTRVIAELCDRETSAEGRAFYGVHVARFSVHLEVLADLASNIHATLGAEGVNLDGQGSPFVLDPYRKVELLAQQFPNLLDSYDVVLRLTAFNCIFYLGTIAVLRALRERFATGGEGFDCWHDILTDVESVTHLHWRVVNTANCTALSFLRAAFDIEVDETLGLLTGPLRVQVRAYMEDMFNRLPVHNAAAALDPIISPLL